jgi:uncharacterized protein
MEKVKILPSFVLGFFIFIGLGTLGYFFKTAFIESKNLERTVIVKGLSEKEVLSNIVIMPIKLTRTSNNLESLIIDIDNDTNKVIKFLKDNGLKDEDITLGAISIVDKMANEFSNQEFSIRYLATKVINIYSSEIEKVRALSGKLSELSQTGILFKTDDYDSKIEYVYTKLNDIKPSMIEEATSNARAVAQKFAHDSNSKLGKIKKATQGQFEVISRDKNSEHIKNIRIVSTVEYYLVD